MTAEQLRKKQLKDRKNCKNMIWGTFYFIAFCFFGIGFFHSNLGCVILYSCTALINFYILNEYFKMYQHHENMIGKIDLYLYNGYSTDLDAFLFRDSKGNKRFILENELKNFNITHVSYKKVYSVMQKENNNVQS